MLFSLRVKIAIGIVLCGVLPGLLGLSYSTLVAMRYQQKAALDSQERALATRTISLQNQIEGFRQILLTTAQNPSFARLVGARPPAEQALWKQESNAALLHLTTTFAGQIDEASFIASNGTELARVIGDQVGSEGDLMNDKTNNDYFKPALGLPPAQVAVTGPYMSPNSGRPVYAFATPIGDATAGKIGILQMEVPLEQIRSSLYRLGGDYMTLLVDDQGHVLIQADQAARTADQAVNDTDRLAGLTGEALPRPGVRTVPFQHDEITIAVSATAALPNAYLVITRPERTRAIVWQNISQSLGVTGISILLLLGLAMGYSVRLARPILRIREAALQVAAGNLQVSPVPETSRDEMGEMARAFNDMVLRLRGVLSELNERSTELELRTEELARANRLKSMFLATMSHELRTPMNGIIGYAQVLLDGLDGPLSPEQAEDVKLIAVSAERLLALINDILDISKIEAGRVVLQRESVNLAETAHDVIGTVTSAFTGPEVAIVVELDEVPPVYADPHRLRQILLNLVSNAYKFTERGEIRVFSTLCGPDVAISVQDTGPGIPPEAQGYIFDEFRQADSTTTRKHGGTGLGLAITRRLVEMHGGTVSLQSTVGVGSTFTFTLPLYASPAAKAAAPLMLERSRPVVLCIDDDPHTLDLLERFLEPLGPELHRMLTAAEGTAAALRLHPDLVILDIQLPDASGWTVLDAIRRQLGPQVPVMILSIVENDDQHRSVDGHLVKPIRRDELLQVAQRLLSQHAEMRKQVAAAHME